MTAFDDKRRDEIPTEIENDFDPGEAGPQVKYEIDRELLADEARQARWYE